MAPNPQVKDDDDIIEDDDDIQIEIEDDTPEEDRKHKRAKAGDTDDDDKSDDDDDDDEVSQYSDNVQKRIKKLRFEYHEERRAKEEAKRVQDEAVRATQTAYEELRKLRKQLADGEGMLFKEAGSRIDAQMAAARRELKEAYDEGDSEKIVEAQSKLSAVSAEKSRLDGYRPRKNSPEETGQPKPQAQQPQRKQPTDMAKRWAQENEWFNSDSKMTAYAFGVHDDLIRNRGVQPDTEEYYRQIDKEMRKVFPSKFSKDIDMSDDDDDTPASVVAAPSRKAPRKPRTVRLTQTQVNLAKRLGITPQQYAEQLMKDRK